MEMPLMSAVQDGVTRDSVARTLAGDEFVDAFSRIPASVDLPVTNHVVHSISSALPRSPRHLFSDRDSIFRVNF